jgi:hypothetical protein
MAFAFLTCALALLVPLGSYVRTANYINASSTDVARGGLVYNATGNQGSVVLMGDSTGSMYARMVQRVTHELHLKLTVISVAAADPLPNTTGTPAPLWINSLNVTKQQHPDFILFSCNWVGKLHNDKRRLAMAIDALKPYTHHLVLITMPPKLPANATRESIRNGQRPPFFEDASERAERQSCNLFVKSFQGANVSVLDAASAFELPNGEVRYLTSDGHFYYFDRDHLSDLGADFIEAKLRPMLESQMKK